LEACSAHGEAWVTEPARAARLPRIAGVHGVGLSDVGDAGPTDMPPSVLPAAPLGPDPRVRVRRSGDARIRASHATARRPGADRPRRTGPRPGSGGAKAKTDPRTRSEG